MFIYYSLKIYFSIRYINNRIFLYDPFKRKSILKSGLFFQAVQYAAEKKRIIFIYNLYNNNNIYKILDNYKNIMQPTGLDSIHKFFISCSGSNAARAAHILCSYYKHIFLYAFMQYIKPFKNHFLYIK